MKYRVAAALLFATTLTAAAPKTPPAKTIAPDSIGHADAMFLSSLSNHGARRVSFKATAAGTYFFLEEPTGVSVYTYDGSGYRRERFMKGTTLDKVLKVYAKKTAVKR